MAELRPSKGKRKTKCLNNNLKLEKRPNLTSIIISKGIKHINFISDNSKA